MDWWLRKRKVVFFSGKKLNSREQPDSVLAQLSTAQYTARLVYTLKRRTWLSTPHQIKRDSRSWYLIIKVLDHCAAAVETREKGGRNHLCKSTGTSKSKDITVNWKPVDLRFLFCFAMITFLNMLDESRWHPIQRFFGFDKTEKSFTVGLKLQGHADIIRQVPAKKGDKTWEKNNIHGMDCGQWFRCITDADSWLGWHATVNFGLKNKCIM